MREAAGQTVKSSISHTYLLDTRDDRITATRGFYTKLFQELAGLGGDAKFYKVEAEGQVSRPIVDSVVRSADTLRDWRYIKTDFLRSYQTFSLSARTGLLWGLSRSTLFTDRFQLGGPTSIRSFKANSMGPRDGCMCVSSYGFIYSLRCAHS